MLGISLLEIIRNLIIIVQLGMVHWWEIYGLIESESSLKEVQRVQGSDG